MPVVLQNENSQAVIAPEYGAALMAWKTKLGGKWVDLTPDATQDTCDLQEASFLMIPYSNRIEHGKFVFAGTEYQLRDAENHAIHGTARRRQWKIVKNTEALVRCTFDTEDFDDCNWPWSFSAVAEYEVKGTVLRQYLSLTNTDSTAMPAGFGWHPYFSRALSREGETVRFRMNYGGVYPDANNNRIPSGPPQEPPEKMDFRQEKTLAPDNYFDCCSCCCGYDGEGYIVWPESGGKIVFECSKELGHMVMYNPQGKPYFALEPVSNANNGFNLLAQGDQTSGVVILQPGEKLQAEFNMIFEKA
jgi:aldose 1-epimerase